MPTQDLNVALLPFDMRLGDIAFNTTIALKRIASLPSDIDLVVLPELATTGFGDIRGGIASLAEEDNGPTIQKMCEASIKYNVAICGGFVGKIGDSIYNRCYFISNGEPKAFYSKRHLFAGPEQKCFSKGDSLPPVIDYKSWKLRPLICYDLRFPVWCRSMENNFDAIILIANWPNSRFFAWQNLITARAIENQAYVAACNREGEDVYGMYGRGDSMIVNALGMPVSTTLEDGTVTGRFDSQRFNTDRDNFKPWKMADKFSIDI